MKISEILRLDPEREPARYNDMFLDVSRGGLVDAAGKLHSLRPQSVRVLVCLSARAGDVVTKEQLFAEVWPDTAVTDDSLTQCIGDIRRALGDADRRVLETIPRRGFRLHRDPVPSRTFPTRLAMATVLGAALLMLAGAFWRGGDGQEEVPTISILAGEGTEALAAEVGAALDRYASVRRKADGGRFVLQLSRPSVQRFSAELTEPATSAVLLSQVLPDSGRQDETAITGNRLATSVASPRSGAIARALIGAAHDKPVAILTPYECYLHYFQWASEETFRRAEACVTSLVEREPGNAKALALLGSIYTEQYWYGTGLDAPERDNRDLRLDLVGKALASVQAAEAAGLPADAEVHLAIARSYYGNCKKEHMIAALRRAMELNPNDPAILGSAGNWVAYSGDWADGVALARRAIELAQEDYERWWYWPIGKDAWLRGDYEAALDGFMRGYMENDWHTQLHLAYTLPYLDRLDEARDQVGRLREVYPGFTRADARSTHRRWCFDEAFITRMDTALARAGLPDAPDTAFDDPMIALTGDPAD